MAGSILSQEKSSARPLRAALYARVSTLNNGQSPEMQIRDFTEYCQRRGWTATEYVDVGVSGAKDRRPELDRLMVDAHRRCFDVVVVWKFDRFARSVSHLLRALETFNSLGIAFVSLGEQIDTSTPAGRMIFTVLGAVAELERSLIAERVRAGMRNARARGKKIGRLPGHNSAPRTVKRLERLIGVGRLASASWQRDSILPSGWFSGARLHTERNLLPSRELETDQS